MAASVLSPFTITNYINPIAEALEGDPKLCKNDEWVHLANALSLTPSVIKSIDEVNQRGQKVEVFVAILKHWDRRSSDVDNVHILEFVLQVNGYEEASRALRHLWNDFLNESRSQPFADMVYLYPRLLQLRECQAATTPISGTEIRLDAGDVGYPYKKIFEPYRASMEHVKSVTLEDPYIINDYQIHNFENFLDAMIELCPELETFELETSRPEGPGCRLKQKNQKEKLNTISHKDKKSILGRSVHLKLTFPKTNMHDRWIRFDNGWKFSLLKGLDIYERCDPTSEEYHDFSKRKCVATTITAYDPKLAGPTRPF